MLLARRRSARTGALRVLDFATTGGGAAAAEAAARFVDAGGLPPLFGIFMGKARAAAADAPRRRGAAVLQ